MNTYTCTEKPNTENLDKIIKANKIDKSQHTQLKQYQDEHNNGVHDIKFRQKKEVGRLTPDGMKSVHGFKRDVRKALMNDKYIDIDMTNCHPTILQKIFHTNNLPSPKLDDYITNRNTRLEELSRDIDKTLTNLKTNYKGEHAGTKNTKHKKIKKEYLTLDDARKRDLAKSQFLKLMYGGKPNDLKFECKNEDTPYHVEWNEGCPQLLNDFYREFLKNSTDLLCTIDKYQKYMKYANPDKPNNILGSGLAILAQDEERKCLSSIVQVFEDFGYTPSTLIHDGLLIEKTDELEAVVDGCKVLQACETAILEEHGYTMKVITKPLHDFDNSILGDEDETESKEIDDNNHTEIAKQFITELDGLGHKFVYAHGQYYWYRPTTENYTHGVYEFMTPKLWNDLNSYMEKSKVIPEKKRGSTKYQNDLKSQIKGLIVDVSPSWNDKIITSVYKKVPFKNGVYCFDKKELIPYDSSMLFLQRGELIYKTQPKEIVDKVYKQLFLDPYDDEEKARFMTKILARAIAGHINDRRFYIIKGKPGSCKGTLTEAMNLAFGSLCHSVPAGNFCRKDNSGEVAKRDSWKLGCKTKRFLCTHELPNGKIDTETVKHFCSGGDDHHARKNYGEEEKFTIPGTCFWFFNQMCKFHGLENSTKTKIKVIQSKTEYIKQNEVEHKKKLHGGKLPDYMKIAIEEIKEVWLREEHILQAFAQLIIEAYGTDCPVVPAIIQEETDDFLEDDNMDDKLQSLYLFTDKNEDEMWLKDLERRCKTEKMFLNTADIRKNITDWTGVKWGKRTTRNGQKDYPIKGFKLVPQNEDDLLQGFQFTTNH